MTRKLQTALKKAVDNLQHDRSKLCSVILAIVEDTENKGISFKDTVAGIIDVEPRLSEKEIFTAYNIAVNKLIPEAWSINRFEVVKFLANSASLKQQQEMLKNGVLVASRAHPEGHLVRLFDLKNCQIRYAWNFKLGRLFTDSERLAFARRVFTGVSNAIKPKTIDVVEGSISPKSFGAGHTTLRISGSVRAIDIAKAAFKNKIQLRHFKNHKRSKDYYIDVVKVLRDSAATFRGTPEGIGPNNFATDKFGNAVLVLEHERSFIASEINLLLINLFALQLKKELSREFTAIDKL